MVLSQRCIISAFPLGIRYAGSSIINGEISPRWVVFLISIILITATVIPNTYIHKLIKPPSTPKNVPTAPETAASIGSFAPQEKKGMVLMVIVFSLSSARVLVFIIAGIEQPKPIIIGINALPDTPNFLNILSKIKATLAMYPESSNIDSNKSKNTICGTKESTPPRPPSTPSPTKLTIAGDAPKFAITSVINPKEFRLSIPSG